MPVAEESSVPVRRLALAVVPLVATSIVLTACGDDDPTAAEPSVSASASDVSPSEESSSPKDSPSSTASEGESGELPTVTGGFGEKPTIKVPDADPPADLVVKTLTKGKGQQVETGDVVVVNYLGVRWEDGETFDSSFDSAPAGFQIGVGRVIPGWDSALVGQPIGSRLLLVVPPDLAYGDTPPGEPLQPGDTLVFVVDLLGKHQAAEAAKGEPAPTEDDSLPAVSLSPREPDINLPPGSPPNRLVAIPVVVGEGPKVQKGDTLVLQYKGVIWRNGKPFDSSWTRGEPLVVTIGQGAVVPGWDKGLVGQTVGSRVLLVIPPSQGYGDAGNPPVKPTDTMVFAVDILGAY